MTKLYSMDQHSQAIKMKFSVSFTYGNQGLWKHMVEYHGKELIMKFPSGKECFFLEILHNS